MPWSPCGPRCVPAGPPPPPPPYRRLELAFSFLGTAGFLADLGADAWAASLYLRSGQGSWGGVSLGLMALSSLALQFFSWAWHRGDPEAVRQRQPLGRRTLLALHLLQLGYLHRCLHALKVGFNVCQMETAVETERAYAIFLSHDISLLRLFETFLESAPQLTLVLYIILHTSKVEIFQILGICTSFFCIAWALLDYHQSLRSFLQEKDKLNFLSSVLYFLWNFLLVCPRILSLALFAVLFPRYIFLHFLGIWSAMFLWVSLQGTNLMEDNYEWTYRSVVAVILYFCWFNVAVGKTCHRSAIYHTFMLLDNIILSGSWLWHNDPLSMDPHLLHVLFAALPCYILGILLRGVYYKYFHPTVQAASPSIYDEVDSRGSGSDKDIGFQQMVVMGHVDHWKYTNVVGHLNIQATAYKDIQRTRIYKLSQNFFMRTLQNRQHQENGTLVDIYL